MGEAKDPNFLVAVEIDVDNIRTADDNVLYWRRTILTDKKGNLVSGRNIFPSAYRFELFSVDCKDLKSALLHTSFKDENENEIYSSSVREDPKYYTPGSDKYNTNNIACLISKGHLLPGKINKVEAVKLKFGSVEMEINFLTNTLYRDSNLVYVWEGKDDFFPKTLRYNKFDCEKKTVKVIGSSRKFSNLHWLEIKFDSKGEDVDISEIFKGKIQFICPNL